MQYYTRKYESLKKFAEKNISLFRNKFGVRDLEVEDIISLLWIEAKHRKKTKFTNREGVWILLDGIRRETKIWRQRPNRVLSLDYETEGNRGIYDILNWREPEKVQNRTLWDILSENGFDRREKEIMYLRFGLNCRLKEIGEKLNLTEARISQILSLSLKKLKEIAAEERKRYAKPNEV